MARAASTNASVAPSADAPAATDAPAAGGVAPETTAVEPRADDKPADPAPASPVAVLVVRGPARGRWRAGRHFGPHEIEIPLASLTPDQVAAIENDPLLSVTRRDG
jgi:hypothetical protein